MKLGIFTSVCGNGGTGMMAVTLSIDEKVETFKWVFRRYLDCFRVQPANMITDGDQWMLDALAAVMPDTRPSRCIWHLSTNVFTHCHPPYAGNEPGWRTFLSMWWRITKETDESACDTWDTDWAALTATLTRDTPANAARAAALKWLADLAARRETWAYRWTWRFFTAGCDSTQRTESVNSVMKSYTTASMLLVSLLDALDAYNTGGQLRSMTRQFDLVRRLAEECAPSPLLQSLEGFTTPFALQLVRSQCAMALEYASPPPETRDGVLVYQVSRRQSRPIGSASTLEQVENEAAAADYGCGTLCSRTRITSLLACSCQFPKHWGLPCRHQLHVLIVTQAAAIPRALVRMLWQLQPEDAAQARLAALLLRAPSYRASTAAPAQHTQQERFSLLCSAFKPLAELASASDAQMNTLLANVNELSVVQRRSLVGSGAGGRGAGGRGTVVASGRGMTGRGAAGHGAAGRDVGLAGAGAAPRARCCTICKQPGHNRTTCRSNLRDLGVVGGDEPLVLPHAPAMPSDSGNEAELPSAPPLEPSTAPLAAPPSAPQPALQPAPQPQSAPTRAGGGGGATVVAINVATLTSLVGHGGPFGLDDLVGAGGVELPHAPAQVANPQVLRGKGRPKVVRYKSSRELKKRKRDAS